MPSTPPDPVARRIRADIRALQAYAVQDARGMVKLDAMENPYALPAHLQQALGQRLGQVAINRYPGARLHDLRLALACYANLPDGFDLMLGNGSDELIGLLALACCQPGASVLAPVPGFVMYAMSAQLQGLAFHGVPLRPDFELDEAAMLEAIQRHQPALIYLAYPNNPTANLWDDAVLERLITAAGQQASLVVIDEAYQPFSSKSYLDRLHQHQHVLLLRTLSKFGLAGVRLGYLIGPAALMAQLDKVRPPYNISALNGECALFALAHQDEFERQAQAIRAERARVLQALGRLPGVTTYPSDANMVLVRVTNARQTFERLQKHRILVKNVSAMHPLLRNCLRLTIGTAEENQRMLAAFEDTP
jgi:histidinol-phosphate aminotransferase